MSIYRYYVETRSDIFRESWSSGFEQGRQVGLAVGRQEGEMAALAVVWDLVREHMAKPTPSEQHNSRPSGEEFVIAPDQVRLYEFAEAVADLVNRTAMRQAKHFAKMAIKQPTE